MCRDLKSAAQVRDFYIWSALTKSYYLKTVWSLLFAFDDFDSLRKVGFDVDFHTATLQHMDKDGDDLANEADLASQFWTRNLSAIGRLVRGHLAHGMTYPGKFAAGLSDDPDEEAWAFNEFQLDFEAWGKLAKVGGGIFWTKMISRSSMNWTVVDETFRLLIAAHWKTEEVKAQFLRLFSHMGSTYGVECVFQKSADHADRDNANKRLHGRGLWALPMQERFLEKIFSFPQVNMGEVVDVPNSNEECGLPEKLFEVKHSACSINASDIVSDKSTTAWQTFGGATYWQILSDQCSLAWCSRNKNNEAWCRLLEELHHSSGCDLGVEQQALCHFVAVGISCDDGRGGQCSGPRWHNSVLEVSWPIQVSIGDQANLQFRFQVGSCRVALTKHVCFVGMAKRCQSLGQMLGLPGRQASQRSS